MEEVLASQRPSWLKKLLFGTVTAAGIFLLLELVLTAVGIKPVRSRRDPFVGFEPGTPLFVRQGDRYVTNPVKLCFFNPQEFPAAKSPRAYRIFCLGGSTTYGHPYDHRTGISSGPKMKISAPCGRCPRSARS